MKGETFRTLRKSITRNFLRRTVICIMALSTFLASVEEAQAAWGVPNIGSLTTVASGNVALTEPAGVAQGDLMIACIAYRSNVAFGLPIGWALVNTQQSSGDTDATNGIASGVMAYIVRGASAPDLTFTRTGGDLGHGRIVSYSGGHSTPLDTGTSNTLGAASVTVTTGTITTAEAGELLVACTSAGDNLTASAFDAATDPTTASGATDTTTAPTNGTWIERADNGTQTGADGALAIADAIRQTAGSTGQFQATISASARHVMMVGAFKLAPAVAPTVTTNAETGVTVSSATLNGEITATGGENATSRGFAWGTVSTLSGGDTSTTTESGSFGTGTYSQALFNLLAGKTYYFRAYATNSAGTGYGSVIESFVTGTDTTPNRSIRLFSSYRIKFTSGKMILHKK